MFKHILIPLDGSRLAEAALAAAVYFVGAFGSKVTLLHVIERGAPQEIHGERHLTRLDEAQEYLDEVAERVFPNGKGIERHVHPNEVKNVAHSICQHVEELGPDLVVMCMHGRGGLRGFMFGRIAQQVVGLCTEPILLVPPVATDLSAEFSCKKLLVPLDGSPEHEGGLTVGAELANSSGAKLSLIRVVHELHTLKGKEAATATMLPATTHALLDIAERNAAEYLQGKAAGLKAGGIDAAIFVRRGDPVTVVLETAQLTNTDLIVLSTHGRSGLDAFWAGSTGTNMAIRSTISLLLVPVGGKKMQAGLS